MGDLVERLRAQSRALRTAIADTSHPDVALVAPGLAEIAKNSDEAAVLLEEAREGFRAIVDGEVPRPVGQIYRQDKKRSKHDLCIHRVPMHDDCGDCTGDFANVMLAKLEGK